MPRTPAFITAQVAVESIVNFNGEGFDAESIAAVLAFARDQGVASFYLDPADRILQQVLRNSAWD